MEVNTRQKLEQGRATFAFTKAKNGIDTHGTDFKQYCKKVPMMIKNHGLGAALAFMYSKGGAQGTILMYLEDWFKADDKCKGLINLITKKLISEITEVDTQAYRALTIEAIAFLTWLRRFADGLTK